MPSRVDLTAPDQEDVSADSLDIAAAFVSGVEAIDAKARRGMLAEVDDRASEVTEYILQQQELYGDDTRGVPGRRERRRARSTSSARCA